MRALDEKEKRSQSSFEREVMKQLETAGYNVAAQWKVGSFRIDLVVEGNGKRLAIECDGDRYHPLERLQEDMDRQSILERMGWVFTRIRGTEFFRNPERTMKPVLEKLQSLEISPVNAKPRSTRKSTAQPAALPQSPSQGLIERVIARAEELLASWGLPQQAASSRRRDSRPSLQKDYATSERPASRVN